MIKDNDEESKVLLDVWKDPDVGGYRIEFYRVDYPDEDRVSYHFTGHFHDLECDPFEISGYSDEIDIITKDIGYVKLGYFQLKLLQKILKRMDFYESQKRLVKA